MTKSLRAISNFVQNHQHSDALRIFLSPLASHFNMDIATLTITKDLDDNTFIKAITRLPDNTIVPPGATCNVGYR